MPSNNEYNRRDRTSLSNPSCARSTHIELVWTIDFTARRLSGSATHTIKILEDGTSTADFDSSSGLVVHSCDVDGAAAPHAVSAPHPALGSRISVTLPPGSRSAGGEVAVTLRYAAGPDASAIQWLDPAATAGGARPYVFTQCQAIHARSIVPCQDAPGVKTTYGATVHAPEWCTVLMSAVAADAGAERVPGVHRFSQPVPISSYLIALCAGHLASREVSPRCRIWSEPSVVDAAAHEFGEAEDFLGVAERLTGCPYVWGRYDVLCLPPSFPYGGMENPCLTFATPTLLAGDRSLADVIAHEIAHSWTGNLVTNATWEHFWLNEGWTVWLERKILAQVKGDVDHAKVSAEIGWKHLRDDVALIECGCAPDGQDFTKLVWPLSDQDPDDAFSGVPYEKGFNTLNFLEEKVGKEAFEAYAQAYIEHFKYKSLTTGEFRDHFEQHFAEAAPEVDWDVLFFGPGLPSFSPDFANVLSASARTLAQQWLHFDTTTSPPASPPTGSMDGWSSQMKCICLEALLDAAAATPLADPTLHALDAAHGLSATTNAEIRFRWHRLCLASDVPWIVADVLAFVRAQGRMKFVRPLYRALAASHAGEEARRVFVEAAGGYHPIARKMIAADLGVVL